LPQLNGSPKAWFVALGIAKVSRAIRAKFKGVLHRNFALFLI